MNNVTFGKNKIPSVWRVAEESEASWWARGSLLQRSSGTRRCGTGLGFGLGWGDNWGVLGGGAEASAAPPRQFCLGFRGLQSRTVILAATSNVCCFDTNVTLHLCVWICHQLVTNYIWQWYCCGDCCVSMHSKRYYVLCSVAFIV